MKQFFRFFMLPLLGMILLFSCKKDWTSRKENNSGDNNSSGNPNGTQLIGIGTHTGTDSITTNFLYNSSNRLISIASYASSYGSPDGPNFQIGRNASNIISSILYSFTRETLICGYDTANSRYNYLIHTFYVTDSSFTSLSLIRDSIALIYSGGKMVSSIRYNIVAQNNYDIVSKDSISYNGNNVASIKYYSYNGNVFDLYGETKYEQYDDKINPLNFADVAPVLGMTDYYPTYYSANNLIKRTGINYNIGNTNTVNFSYTYNASNLPAKAVSTDGINRSTYTYYYQ